MEKINEILKKQKVIAKHFRCTRCGEDNAYSFFDFEQKINKWRCPNCNKEDFLMNLNHK